MKNLRLFLCSLVVMPIYGQDLTPPSYNFIGLGVSFDKTFDNSGLQSKIQMFLQEEQIGAAEKNITNSHLSLAFKDSIYTITQMPDNRVVYKIDNSKPKKTLQILKEIPIENYSKTEFNNGIDNFIQEIDENTSRILLASGTHEVTDFWNNSLDHYPFASKLIKALEDEKEFISPGKIYSYVRGNATKLILKKFRKYETTDDFLSKFLN